MSETRAESPAPIGILTLMLVVSGCCALIFQVVWIRELRLIFGATTASSAAVLAIFMAGLGLGNGLLGRRIDASVRPLRYYGFLEAGIAISAGLSPLLIDLVRQLYIGVGGQTSIGPAAATVVRLLASGMILAIPTFLMGGTMPAAARAVSNEADTTRRGVALLYGLNTLGAVAGAGFANFYLLEAIGNRAVLWSACGLNLLLAAAAIGLSRCLTNRPVAKVRHPNRQPARIEATDDEPGRFRLVCLAAGIVGFVFFQMEIVWYRMLGPLLGGTTYTFGLILCVALLGIGIGGALYWLLARWLKPSLPLLAAVCAVEGLAIAIPFWRGDGIALWVIEQQRETIDSFGKQIWHWAQVGSYVILLPAIIAGFQFPLLIAIAGTGRRDVGKHVGFTFAANTLGAILGSLAGGFLLLPILTAPGLWRVSVATLLLLAIVLTVIGRSWKSLSTGVAGMVTLLAIAAIAQQGPTAVWRHSGIGVGRAEFQNTDRNAVQEFMNSRRRQCLWEAEGIESSVAITATDSLAFIVNGKSDGNAYGDAGTQIGLGLIGPLLHASPKTGLVIGLGTGESAGWMADAAGMSSVDVVELEPAIVSMCERCSGMNRDVLQNPKVHLHFNDAREYLLTSGSQYDLIVSEPSNPYRAGIANLYTREFYESAAARLADDGLFLQWLQGYEVDNRTVRIVLRTIRSVFPEVQIWQTKSRDMVIVCGKSAAALSYSDELIAKRLKDPTIGEGLKRAWRVDDLEGVLAHYSCGSRTIDQLLQDHNDPLNTDNRNLLEYAFAKTVGQSIRFSIQELRSLAVRIDDTSPVASDRFDHEKVRQRRLAMSLQSGREIPADANLDAGDRDRAEAYRFYLAGRYADAVARFKTIDVDFSCPIETRVYAHALAETGQDLPDAVVKRLREVNETEAAAVAAIGHWRTNERAAAIDEIVATFRLMQTNPWGDSQLLTAVIGLAAGLSDVDRAAARRVYDHVRQPFAMYRLEDRRLMLQYILSETLESRDTLDALSALEPHVPWKGWFLENRARVYAAQKHELAERAREDLERFRAWAASGR